jgi:hypothetical protein
MIHIDQLLKKFKKLIPTDRILKKLVVHAIKNNTGIDIPIRSIEISGKRIHVRGTPYERTEIIMRRDRILHEIHSGGSKENTWYTLV